MSTEKNMTNPKTAGSEMVKIRLFKDNARYKGDVFVGLNAATFKIQRGVDVEVPRGVAEILEHSETQDAKTMQRIEAVRQM